MSSACVWQPRCVSVQARRCMSPSVHEHVLTQLEQPALAVGVEEGVSEVVAVVLGDGEGLTLDAVEEVLPPREGRERPAVTFIPVQGLGPACVASGRSLALWANSFPSC